MQVRPGSAARRGGASALLLAALLLTGCGTMERAAETPWPASEVSVATEPLVWESFGRVHLADETVIDLGPGRNRRWVAAGPGVWWYLPGHHLTLSTASKQITSTVQPWWSVLSSSADGRWLVYAESVEGVPELVTLDTASGEVTSRTDVGLAGAESGLGWQKKLREQQVGVLGFAGDLVFFRSPGTVHSIDMTSGDTESWPVDQPPPGTPALDQGPSLTQGPWTIKAGADRFLGIKKNQVRLHTPGDAGKPALLRWLERGTALAIWQRPGRPDALLSCHVRGGQCHLVLGTEEGFTLPNGSH